MTRKNTVKYFLEINGSRKFHQNWHVLIEDSLVRVSHEVSNILYSEKLHTKWSVTIARLFCSLFLSILKLEMTGSTVKSKNTMQSKSTTTANNEESADELMEESAFEQICDTIFVLIPEGVYVESKKERDLSMKHQTLKNSIQKLYF